MPLRGNLPAYDRGGAAEAAGARGPLRPRADRGASVRQRRRRSHRAAVRRMARPDVRDRGRAAGGIRGGGGTVRKLLLAVLIASGALVAPSAGGATFVSATNCLEHQAFVDGDDAAVTARLPKHYTPVRDVNGTPLVFARALHCEQATVDGKTGPMTLASIGVVIESPDGVDCGSGVPAAGGTAGTEPPICNWYTLFWLSDSRATVNWLRAGTPGVRATYAPNLVFKAGDSFHFEAPGRYSIDDVPHEQPGQIAVRGAYWTDTPQGTMKLAISSDDLSGGQADGTVRAPAGSEMAALMGAPARDYATADSGFSAVRIGHGSYRKQLLWPARNTDSFDGSCSLQGQVKFNPPATDAQQELASSYDASGTCSGKLDGRSVSNAPVRMQQSGHSYASCSQAMTTSPWIGLLTFGDGTRIGYTLDFESHSTELDGTDYGDRSGRADVSASFLTQRTSPDVAAQCAGDGVKETPMDLTLTTKAPLVSDRPRLNLSVRPRVVRAGRRTAFTFKAAQGALIRFAGKHAVAGPGGKATIVATLRRRGVRRATAAKAGFVTARVAVRVHAS